MSKKVIFHNPPVVETVLGAQFSRLSAYRTAHAGVFWKSYLDASEWPTIAEAIRVDDQFERFGEERMWGPLGGMRLLTSIEAQRTQFTSADQHRMIQIQDSRFLYNWQKAGTEEAYATFDNTKPAFTKLYSDFRKFSESSGLGQIEENQWEITYINHITKGELWNRPEDWNSIFPWFNFPKTIEAAPDTVRSEWSLVIPENRGRLYVNVALARTSIGGPETLIVTMSARGPVSPKTSESVSVGLEIGHDFIVRSFRAMASRKALDFWELDEG